MSTLDYQVRRFRHVLEEWVVNQPDQLGAYWYLKRAKGLLFLTTVKGGFFFSGALGYGLFMKQVSEGKWSGPVSVILVSGGAGLQFGLCKSETVVVLTSDAAVAMFESHGQLRLGAEYVLAMGPAGLNVKGDAAVNRKGVSAQGSVSNSVGLFLGISMDGTLLLSNHWVNHAYYHSKHAGLKNILHGKIPIPQERMRNLQRLVQTLSNLETAFQHLGEEYDSDPEFYAEDAPVIQTESEAKRDSRVLPLHEDEDVDKEDE